MISRINQDQKGISLVELLVAAAISSVIIGAFFSVALSVIRFTGDSNAHVALATNNENTARLISWDGQMAQNTDLIPGALPVSHIKLTWIDPVNGDSHEVYYYLSGGNLLRQEYLNTVLINQKTVLKSLSNIGFFMKTGEQNGFMFTLTLSRGSPAVTETREYHVAMRSAA